MQPQPIKTCLRDGTPILIRAVEPEDKHLLEIGFEHLSDRSRYFRFLHTVHYQKRASVIKFVVFSDNSICCVASQALVVLYWQQLILSEYSRVFITRPFVSSSCAFSSGS